MAFPMTHLFVANHILKLQETACLSDIQKSEFLLGSLSPDAVHYRKSFINAKMGCIGSAKKITHLSPVSDERWGSITDNDGWINCVKTFLCNQEHSFILLGYAAHVLTDIYNNMYLWNNFRTKYPAEAAKGYESEYYKDLRRADLRLYQSLEKDNQIEKLLPLAKAKDLPGLVTKQEIIDIRNNILYESYPGHPPQDTSKNTFLTYEQVQEFVKDAAEFVLGRDFFTLYLRTS